VRDLRLRPRVATVLEAEGVLIDPIGAILAVLLLEITLAPGADSLTSAPVTLVYSLGFGAIAGALGGLALFAVLRVRNFVPEGLENVFTLAAVLLLFQGCHEIVPNSGILAVTLAGVVVGNLRTHIDRDLREFKDQLTVLLIGLLFVLLAADVRLSDVVALGWNGVAVIAVLIFLVRPLNVWLSTIGSALTYRERWFVSWIAPRGIIAAAVASVTATALESNGIEGGAELRALVFLCIVGTVVLAGLTARPVATLLKVRLPGRDTVAILGAEGLGLQLAIQLRAGGVPVVFIDSNPDNCRAAEEAGFQVVYGDALQERTLQRGRFENVGSAIGTTPNQMLNSLFASRARQLFGVPRGYVAVAKPQSGLAPELVERGEIVVLFEGPHDVERWDVRARHGEMEVDYWEYGDSPAAQPDESTNGAAVIGERFVILTIRRADGVVPMHQGLAPAPGDVAAVAIHSEERESAAARLRSLGWVPHEAPAAAES
jgi:Trk K+ transport system NAD-binding subunit